MDIHFFFLCYILKKGREMDQYSTNQDVKQARQIIDQIIHEVSKVIIGKSEVIRMALATMLASGHVLFDDIPGVGKTTLVRAMATALGLDFKRIQFTPDLMPADILGTSVFDQANQKFVFHRGPIFTDIVLADEINRATPRTQSALLEAMSDLSVTVDNQRFDLDSDFWVLGTQNPLSFEGTYPLPEAQLDRFLMCLRIGYPEFNDEINLMYQPNRSNKMTQIHQVVDRKEIRYLKQLVSEVHLAKNVASYILNLVTATRNDPAIKLGISPRGTMALVQVAKAYAVTVGEDYVSPELVQQVLIPVFCHRLVLSDAEVSSLQPEVILEDLVSQVAVPVR